MAKSSSILWKIWVKGRMTQALINLSLHQVLASQVACSNRRNDYHLYIGCYWVTTFFFTQTKQTPRLNWRLLNLATELSNLTFAGLSLWMSYFFMSKWVSFSDKKNKFSLRKQVLNFFCLLVAGSGNKKGRDLWILKYLISTSSSSFSIRLIFDPQFFFFSLRELWSWGNFFGSPFKLAIIYAWFR